MLDKKSKQVLAALNKAKDKSDYVNGSNCLLPYLKNFSVEQIDKTLWYLESKDYVQCNNAENTVWTIKLDYKALNYKEFDWMEIKDFVLKSFVTPIVVSIITTIITLVVSSYFKK